MPSKFGILLPARNDNCFGERPDQVLVCSLLSLTLIFSGIVLFQRLHGEKLSFWLGKNPPSPAEDFSPRPWVESCRGSSCLFVFSFSPLSCCSRSVSPERLIGEKNTRVDQISPELFKKPSIHQSLRIQRTGRQICTITFDLQFAYSTIFIAADWHFRLLGVLFSQKIRKIQLNHPCHWICCLLKQPILGS